MLLIAGGVIDALGRGQDIGLFTGDTKNLAVKRSRIAGIVILGLVAILVVAWIDGGEEPLHPISQPVEIPESAR